MATKGSPLRFHAEIREFGAAAFAVRTLLIGEKDFIDARGRADLGSVLGGKRASVLDVMPK